MNGWCVKAHGSAAATLMAGIRMHLWVHSMMVDNAGSTHSDKFATNGLASENSSGSLMGRDAMGIEDRADGSTATMGIAS